ncbi:MAG: hypothetical protein B7Y26_03385 [Hydrogenophilales bacterium 16-64-46]|nr:MAG: hypothetical protein B7Z32_03085 [Hydrogenophilales bacterium 12-64-13]OYZ06840.1 MAG: hypothetical protein B7Y26_03385 [Hydrogenophilales bacterium 16-64-46]OZA39546.1 MAG: hypothetical protein B7X87_04490 [Hydrogenophilales bacterium 17-64-34]HQS99863.1 FAD-binding domain-containing protein [Thiobacillus sp.]
MSHARLHHPAAPPLPEGRVERRPAPRRADLDHFPPSRVAALRRLLGVNPVAYARTRNYLDGAVTGLSPYFTHGFVTEAEAFAAWRARFGVSLAHKLGMELAWRGFFAHVRGWAGDAIFVDLRPALRHDYAPGLPADLVEGRTGVPVIDASVRRLYATGYLHNHARLWLASYAVHVRKSHWRAGADWMLGHLLDGDAASNHLSWQWVAATFSARPYLFNAENVARYAPALASPGTAIDIDYAALDDHARHGHDAGPEPGVHPGVAVPPLFAAPPGLANAPLPPLAGRRVALVHPWSLGWVAPERGDFTLGVIDAPQHAARPWSARRWDFVLDGMRRRCDAIWIGDTAELAAPLHGASCVARVPPEPGYLRALAGVDWHTPPPALPEVEPATSFSGWIKRIERAAPGLFVARS